MDMLEKRRIAVGDTTLAVIDEGTGPPVLLLHGFPDSAHTWRHQIAALGAAGYRTIVPDMRGFGESDMPTDVAAYRISTIARDAVGLLDALGIERSHVVGHDWGALTAWLVAALFPQRVERLAVLAVAHPATARDPTIEQRELWWYMLLFQFAGVAEALLQRDDWRLFRAWTRGDGDTERYIADLSRPGALTAALNYYRANSHPERELQRRPVVPSVAAPTLGLWGSRDRFLTEEPMRRSGDYVEGEWRYERIDGASHWPHLDAPGRVNELLIAFLAGAQA